MIDLIYLLLLLLFMMMTNDNNGFLSFIDTHTERDLDEQNGYRPKWMRWMCLKFKKKKKLFKQRHRAKRCKFVEKKDAIERRRTKKWNLKKKSEYKFLAEMRFAVIFRQRFQQSFLYFGFLIGVSVCGKVVAITVSYSVTA